MEQHNISKNSFKVIQIIYTVLMLGLITFSVVVYAFAENHSYEVDTSNVFFIAVPLVSLSGIYLSNLLFTKIVNSGISSDTLNSKLVKYQTATIVKAACLEGPAFLAIVVAYITSNIIFISIALLLVVIMYLTFPTKDRFRTAFNLNSQEKSELDKL